MCQDIDSDTKNSSAPVAGADLRAALVASCFRGALPPVDLRAVCFVRAIVEDCKAQAHEVVKSIRQHYSERAMSHVGINC